PKFAYWLAAVIGCAMLAGFVGFFLALISEMSHAQSAILVWIAAMAAVIKWKPEYDSDYRIRIQTARGRIKLKGSLHQLEGLRKQLEYRIEDQAARGDGDPASGFLKKGFQERVGGYFAEFMIRVLGFVIGALILGGIIVWAASKYLPMLSP
ncbi:MAG: hypothetical protein AAF585_16205, partial [Verrucomicrobiota bacterium]